MGSRDYSPGLNRFTTRDRYNGALADMSLCAAPYAGNRYSFTGGNPVSRTELDGHSWLDPIKNFFSGGGKVATKAPKGVFTAVEVFFNGIGWNTPTVSNSFESDPGDTPNYNNGLLLKPDSKKERQPADTPFPFTRDDCAAGQTMTY